MHKAFDICSLEIWSIINTSAFRSILSVSVYIIYFLSLMWEVRWLSLREENNITGECRYMLFLDTSLVVGAVLTIKLSLDFVLGLVLVMIFILPCLRKDTFLCFYDYLSKMVLNAALLILLAFALFFFLPWLHLTGVL